MCMYKKKSRTVVVVSSHYFRSCFCNVACRTSSWKASSPKKLQGPRMMSFCAVTGIVEEANEWRREWQMLSTLQRGGLIWILNRICKHFRIKWRHKAVDWDSVEQQTLGAGSQTRMDPHPPVHVYMLPMEPKKKNCSLCAKKKRDHPGFNQLKETGDTCCQAAKRNCLSQSEDSGSVGTCVESTQALILHCMWSHGEKKKAAIIRAMSE